MGKEVNHLTKFQVYCEKRAAYDKAHAASSKAYAEWAEAERELVDSMNDENVAGFEMKSEERKLKVSLRRNFSVAVNKDNEFQIREWLTDTEGDIRLFTREELNKSSISNHIRDKIAKGELNEGDVPEFFKLKTTPSVIVRGWDKNSKEEKDE